MTTEVRHVAIFGATGTIAQAIARRYASAGAALTLVARDPARVDTVAADLRARGASSVVTVVADLASGSRAAEIVALALPADAAPDLALLAWGSLTDQPRASENSAYLAAELECNFVAMACLAEALARRMRAGRGGTVALIGSVAGDRVRVAHYAYAAAKAAIDAFATGLRAAHRDAGVRVVVVKPGPIASPMTAHLAPNPLWTTAEAAAATIVAGIARGRSVVYVPRYWRLAMLVLRCLPERIFQRLRG